MNARDMARIESAREEFSISISFPTRRTYPEKMNFETHINRVASELDEKLSASQCPAELAERLKRKVNEVFNQINTMDLLDGLVIYVNDSLAISFKLPVAVREQVVVANRFPIRELLVAAERTCPYWLLAISEQYAHLYHGREDYLEEFLGDGFPCENVVQEAQSERATSSSVAAVASTGASAARSAGSTHLPGDYARDISSYREEHLKQFFRKVDDSLGAILEATPDPLILAGIERSLVSFKEVSKHKAIAVGALKGSYNKTNLSDLANLARPIAERNHAESCQQNLAALSEARGLKKAAQGIQEVWQVAQEGRCRTLLVEEDFYSYAAIAADGLSLDLAEEKAEGVDRVEEIIQQVRKTGGSVVFYRNGELDECKRIAAVLRY